MKNLKGRCSDCLTELEFPITIEVVCKHCGSKHQMGYIFIDELEELLSFLRELRGEMYEEKNTERAGLDDNSVKRPGDSGCPLCNGFLKGNA
mgnify:CR=1 FL=1